MNPVFSAFHKAPMHLIIPVTFLLNVSKANSSLIHIAKNKVWFQQIETLIGHFSWFFTPPLLHPVQLPSLPAAVLLQHLGFSFRLPNSACLQPPLPRIIGKFHAHTQHSSVSAWPFHFVSSPLHNRSLHDKSQRIPFPYLRSILPPLCFLPAQRPGQSLGPTVASLVVPPLQFLLQILCLFPPPPVAKQPL